VATHESSRKRARQAEKRRIRNRHINSGVKGVVKAANTALATGTDVAAATRRAESVIHRAARKGVLSKKQASRRISRLARRAHKVAAK
jgi:small subunit ribosomal protein S20